MKKLYWNKNYGTAKLKKEKIVSITGDTFNAESCQKELVQLSARVDDHNTHALRMAAKTVISQSGIADLSFEYNDYKEKIEKSLRGKKFNEQEIAQATDIMISAISNEDISLLEASKVTVSGNEGYSRKISNLKFISLPKILGHLAQLFFMGHEIITGNFIGAAAVLIAESLQLADEIEIKLSDCEIKILLHLNKCSNYYCSLKDIVSSLNKEGFDETTIKREIDKLVEFKCLAKLDDGYKMVEKISIK